MIRQAAILAGGLGTRLGARTRDVPKPLMECGGRPFLGWLIRELSRFGIEEVLLLAGHLAPVLEAAVPAIVAGLPKKVAVTVSVEPVRAGTGGALFHAADRLGAEFMLLNGDSILDCNLARLAGGAGSAIVLREVKDTDRYGVVRVGDGLVRAFAPRAERPGAGLVNAGIYRFGREVFDFVQPVCSLEADVLPAMAAAGLLAAEVTDGWFVDIGIPEDLERAEAEVPRRFRRPALMLDRDGTINRDHGWVGGRDRWEWVPGAREAIAAATRAGWHVFVVTNQSGIARGLYDEAAFGALQDWVADEVRAAGGTIDDVRFCPFHEEGTVERYRRASDWRKPAPGMILDLIARWELDPGRCVMVGDMPSDLEAAHRAGIAGVAFAGGDLRDAVLPLLDRALR